LENEESMSTLHINNVLLKKTLDFVAWTFYNPKHNKYYFNAMMGKSNVQILKRTDGRCESVNQA